ncbi:hypothetical protein KKA00_04225 [bacterium]|nr:hypothetical protein [bacterium]MBU1651401.1 hypothetical protein [bacterium]
MKKNERDLSCAAVSEKLLSLYDQQKLEYIDSGLAGHLDSCAACRQEYEELLCLHETLAASEVADPGEDYWVNFLPKLRWRMDREGKPGPRSDFAWIPSMGLAVLLIMALLKSPTPVAPPTWYTDVYQKYSSDIASQLWQSNVAVYSRETTSNDTSSTEGYLSDSDLDVIEELCTPTKYTSNDPVDQLLDLDNDTLEELFKQLKDRPIIKSS